MADTPAPATAAVPEDPFDLGDTSLYPKEETPAASEKKLPPRAPDGTFVKPEAVPEKKHPDHLVRQAIEFGLEESDLADMTTPTLYKTVNQFLVQERRIASSFAKQRDLEGARVPQPAPAAATPPAEEEFDFGVDLNDFDPRLVAALKKAAVGSKEEVKALRAALAEKEQREVSREMAGNVELLDAAFAKLANPMLGQGTGATLAADPAKQAEFKRRIAILNACGINDLRQVNRLTIMKQLREANELLFGAATPAAPAADPYGAALNGKPKPRISEQDWENGTVARPTQRNGSPELKGEALAIKNLTEKMRDMESQRTDDAELEGIPD